MKALGERLREERLRRNETQQVFASRIGVSIPTYYKMENGDPRVQIGQWAVALDILDHAGDLDFLLAPTEDLFAKYDQSQSPRRQRASRKENK
ncbi:helix-turn-helix domain-containing protein [Trichloromonas sp.]|uniref:helix-turn-helix domain-containing protein n=1 Tax=Trichloromonas sp. TaxID=3069249 RepID=UPI003D819E68